MAIRYFIPDWDDRVDPGYDFATDTHTPGRVPYRDDRYAHELFTTPPYDGILLSRATLDDHAAKRAAIVAAGSVHRYLRLPVDGKHLVLGDCGAFSYWQQDEPPYQTEEVLNYYQDLGFDLGVSIDHLIFAELDAERERRWQITIDNAETFLRLHRSGGYHFTPIGVAQGWSSASYQRAARALVAMGYGAIAVGGLVRSRTADVVRTLAAVQEVVPSSTQIHLFGVNRPEYAQTFAALGVTSFDSASRLRRAWMDAKQNYFLVDDSYTALRIPDAATLAQRLGTSEAAARTLERSALAAVRAYDRDEASLAEAYAATLDYLTFADPELAPQERARIEDRYRRTLAERPWRACPCAICEAIGVEVIIFRGNNRNRRRGFHNTWQLYAQLQRDSAAEAPRPVPPRPVLSVQLELDL